MIALFRPKPGREAGLLACARDHLPRLRARGLATDRPPTVLCTQDGTPLEIFERVSPAAIGAAHADPAVRALWDRYTACCDYVTLADLPEARALFPGFAPIAPRPRSVAFTGAARWFNLPVNCGFLSMPVLAAREAGVFVWCATLQRKPLPARSRCPPPPRTRPPPATAARCCS